MSLLNLCSRLIVTGIHKNARLPSVALSTHESARPIRISWLGTPVPSEARIVHGDVSSPEGSPTSSGKPVWCRCCQLWSYPPPRTKRTAEGQLHVNFIGPCGIEMGPSQELLSPRPAPRSSSQLEPFPHTTHQLSWLLGLRNPFCLSNPDSNLRSRRTMTVLELCHSNPSSVMRSPAVHRRLDSLNYRLFAGDREPHGVDRLLQSRRLWTHPRIHQTPQSKSKLFGIGWRYLLRDTTSRACPAQGSWRYRTLRQPSWRPLAAIAFTPTCSCPDTSCRKVMLVGNRNDSLERPCGCWSLSPCHAHLAQAPVEP